MVDVIADDWQQVPERMLNPLNPSRELGQPRGKLPEPLKFELRVIHNDAASIAERIAQRRCEGRPRIARVVG